MINDRQRRFLTYIRDAIGLIEQRTQDGREAFLSDVDVHLPALKAVVDEELGRST